jgi:acyl-CoA synthetase (AMP-forming)/AMP-acid ligase II
VKHGISVTADQRPGVAGRAVTERIMAQADQAGQAGTGAAVIEAGTQRPAGPCVISWPQFAGMVRAAACGLSRRGLREGDAAGILVGDAASHVLAVHAVRMAGGIAVPLHRAPDAPDITAGGIEARGIGPAGIGPADIDVADVAAQLKLAGARLLMTSAELAEPASQAAERSWVRQVIAFGEAAETTPFGSLLHAPRPGCTGHYASRIEAQAARASAAPAGMRAVLDGPSGLTRQDVVAAAPPCGDPDMYTALLDEALAAGATVVAAPLAQLAAVAEAYHATAAIAPGGTEITGLATGRIFHAG